MKKQILSFLGAATLVLIGCGGGGSSATFDDPTIIENHIFYRVKVVDQTRYLKERFTSNSEGELQEATYIINDDEFPEANRTIPYEIQSSLVYIYDDITIRCSIADRNDSVEFYCLEEGVSGTLPSKPSTIRWKTLEDAISNPE